MFFSILLQFQITIKYNVNNSLVNTKYNFFPVSTLDLSSSGYDIVMDNDYLNWSVKLLKLIHGIKLVQEV